MKTPDLVLGPEWALLELLCLGLTTSDEQRAFEELVGSEQLQWEELLGQALRHKMLPMLAFHVLSAELEGAAPEQVKEHLRSVLDLNRYKTAIFRREAARVVKALDEPGVRFVGRKGIAFEATLYEGNGSRHLGDLDFMVAAEDRDVVIDAMSRLGYEMGLFDWRANEVVPLERREMMILRLNPDHIPVFTVVTHDPVVRYVEVDFANSLTWSRSPFDVPIKVALADISYQPIPGFSDVQLPCFSPVFQFISTVLHLFREAWFDRWLDWQQDVDLMKFGDIVRVWQVYRQALQGGGLVQVLEEFEIVAPVVWVLEHLDRTLHTGIVSALGLEGRVTESWLASAGAPGGKSRRWKGTMRERLYCKKRRELFVDAL
jgi:hypothetical protein